MKRKPYTLKEKMLIFIKQTKKNSTIHALALLVLAFLIIVALGFVQASPLPEVERPNQAVFVATFVGDMMFSRHVEQVVEAYGYDYVTQYVAPYFTSSDYNTGNFEQPIVLNDYPPEEGTDIHFKTSAGAAEALQRINFTTVNLANNHLLDYGEKGLEDTLSVFHSCGISPVGAAIDLKSAQKVSYTTINGIKIATLGFTDAYYNYFLATVDKPTVLTAKPDNYGPLIRKARRNADLVLVHLHFGHEYNSRIHPKEEDLAKAMVDAGADIIIGHHPHIIKTAEIYKNSLILYSLGNLIFDQGWFRTRESVLVRYILMSNGEALIEFIPLLIQDAQPRPINSTPIGFRSKRIFAALTQGLEEGAWAKENNKITVRVDHSHVIEGINQVEKP